VLDRAAPGAYPWVRRGKATQSKVRTDPIVETLNVELVSGEKRRQVPLAMDAAMTLEGAPSEPDTTASVPPVSGATTSSPTPRDGKALIDATRPFAIENRLTSWRELVIVLGVLAATIAGAAMMPWWPARLVASVVAGLTIVRVFIVYHDFLHGAILRGSTVAKLILYPYGVLVLAPPQVWRETHNYHHAHTAQLVGSHIGSYAMVSTDMWKKMSKKDRFRYKAVRHPLTVLFGYVLVFMYGMCVGSLQKSVKKYWDSAVALLVNWTLTGVLVWKLGFATAFFAYLLPLMVACAAGGYLFYAQHNFPDMTVQPRHKWTYTRAALESSSYMELGPIMTWFTGNIGYHHVHHLNPSIPFYRLPEAMSALPELQHPGKTTLSPRDIVKCFSLKLWDPAQNKMVGYPADA
jgi:omega-6 fatty acid desaturase (delta-12 desaturase)